MRLLVQLRNMGSIEVGLMNFEDPIDFPVAWDWHRHYSKEFGEFDPGSNEPAFGEGDKGDREYPARGILEEINLESKYTQLRGMVLYLQNKMNQHTDKSKARKKRFAFD